MYYVYLSLHVFVYINFKAFLDRILALAEAYIDISIKPNQLNQSKQSNQIKLISSIESNQSNKADQSKAAPRFGVLGIVALG